MAFRLLKNRFARKRDAPSTMQRQMLFGILFCIGLLCLILSIWYVTRLQAFTIDEIDISGGTTISHPSIRSQIETVLNGKYMSLIPHRFFLWYPEESIQKTLEEIPRIHTVQLEITDRKKLVVSFSEYVPYALWCLPTKDMQECYFLNDDGFAFAPSPLLKGGSFVRHTFDNKSTLIKGSIMKKEDLFALHQFLAELNQKLSLRVTDVIHTKDGDLNLKINGGGEIRLSTNHSFEMILKNLTSVLESETFMHLAPGNFQYIDLRFGNKIFVNEEELLISTSTASTTEEL